MLIRVFDVREISPEIELRAGGFRSRNMKP